MSTSRKREEFINNIFKNSANTVLTDTINTSHTPNSFEAFASSPNYKAIIENNSKNNKKQHNPARRGLKKEELPISPLPKKNNVSPFVSPRHSSIKNEEVKSLVNIPFYSEPPTEMRCPARLPLNDAKSLSSAQDNHIRLQIVDYQLLSAACLRGKRLKGEAYNNFCIGVLHDNRNDHLKAIPCYERFLSLCTSNGDEEGQYLGFNSLGVAHMLLKNYEVAADYHRRHLESPSFMDRFIGHTNLGLVLSLKNEVSHSAVQHQHALRYAIRLGLVVLQSVAIGNLGISGSAQHDYVTAKACMERYLELSSSLQDTHGRTNAHQTLGKIAQEQGDYKGATEHFHSALRTAQVAGDKGQETQSKVSLGVALGNTLMDDHMKKMAELLLSPKHKN